MDRRIAKHRLDGECGSPLPPLRPAARLTGRLLAALLRLLGATWRRELEGIERLDTLLAQGNRVMIVFWHGEYLPLFVLFAGRQARIFTSRSFRGEVVAAICRRFGYAGEPIPVASGESVVDAMHRILAGCPVAAIAVDGPLGPPHVVKRGAVRLASDLAFLFLPVAVSARNGWILGRRWDRMEVPLPFTRVRLACGEPVRIPAALSEEEIGSWCETLRERMNKVGKRAAQMAD